MTAIHMNWTKKDQPPFYPYLVPAISSYVGTCALTIVTSYEYRNNRKGCNGNPLYLWPSMANSIKIQVSDLSGLSFNNITEEARRSLESDTTKLKREMKMKRMLILDRKSRTQPAEKI